MREAALSGAALVAGIGIGLYADPQSALSTIQKTAESVYNPDESRNNAYQRIYHNGFLPLQDPLREVYKNIIPE